MPLAAVVPAVIGAGATIYASSQASKAANKAQAANDRAAADQLAAQQANFDRIVGLNQPFINGGNAAFDALLRQIVPGYTGAPAASGGTGASGPAAGSPDYAAYFQANPDLQAEYQRLESGKGADMFDSPEEYAAYHYQTFGQNEGRQLPTVAATPATDTATPAQPAGPQTPTDLMSAQRPDAPQAPTFERPAALSAPGAFSYSTKDIENDPGYKFALQEGLNAVNASFAARGKLRAGDTMKALQDRGTGVAHQFDNNFFARARDTYNINNDNYRFAQNRADNVFGQDRAYDTARWQYDTQRQDQNFNTDRSYQTNRFDTQTGNLFNLTNIGLGAAGNVSGAGTNFANAQSNIYGSQANAAADTAYARAAANSQMVGGLAGTAANMFANWGGNTAPTTSGLGTVNYGGVSNPFGNYGQVRF